MARNGMIYGAVSAGLDGFADSALKMMEFGDRRAERELQRKKLAEQEDRQTEIDRLAAEDRRYRRGRDEAYDERQKKTDSASEEERIYNRSRNDVSDLRAEETHAQTMEEKKVAADKMAADRQSKVFAAKAIPDIVINENLIKTPVGESVSPEMLPLINRAKPEYPDLESIVRTPTGIMAKAKPGGFFTGADGRKTDTLEVTEKQLKTMADARTIELTALQDGGAGIELLKKTQEQFGVTPISPAQRAYALGQTIDFMLAQQKVRVDPAKAASLNNQISNLFVQYKKITGISTGPDGTGETDPRVLKAEKDYTANYTRYSTGGGKGWKDVWGYLTNNQGLGDGEKKSLDELWALTGHPPAKAPHRVAEQPDASTVDVTPSVPAVLSKPAAPAASAPLPAAPAAPPLPQPAAAAPAGMVRVIAANGKTYEIPADKVSAAVARGARVVQ